MRSQAHSFGTALPFALPLAVGSCVLVAVAAFGAAGFVAGIACLALAAALELPLGRLPSTREAPRQHWVFSFAAAAWAPVAIALTLTACVIAAAGDVTVFEYLAMLLAVGTLNGSIGMAAAHELLHRKDRWLRSIGYVPTLLCSYPHFSIEHIELHHRLVATRHDPLSARRGETFLDFFPRAVLDGLRGAWLWERARLARDGCAALSTRSTLLVSFALLALTYGAIATFLGARATIFFAAQALLGWATAIAINYVQHYGLARRALAPGRFEPPGSGHAWNCPLRVTNWLLFALGEHAEHHMGPGRHCPSGGRRELPLGYFGATVVALCYPLWRRLMDGRLEEGKR